MEQPPPSCHGRLEEVPAHQAHAEEAADQRANHNRHHRHHEGRAVHRADQRINVGGVLAFAFKAGNVSVLIIHNGRIGPVQPKLNTM